MAHPWGTGAQIEESKDVPRFKAEIVHTNGRTQVRLTGELDLSTAAHLVEAIRRLTAVDGSGEVALEMAGLTFVDGAGLRALVLAHSAVRAAGGHLVLTGLSPLPRRLITVTGLDDVLDVR
jgi:anti-sigma B factor antagonist